MSADEHEEDLVIWSHRFGSEPRPSGGTLYGYPDLSGGASRWEPAVADLTCEASS